MKWLSKYSYKIVEEARDYLEITFASPLKYLGLIKIIIENTLEYLEMMHLTEEEK